MPALTPADESFHSRSDHPHWNESAWFGVTLPDREASADVYFYHRPNMGLSAGGMKVGDPSGSSECDCLGYDWDRTQALPAGSDMFDFSLPIGLTVTDARAVRLLRHHPPRFIRRRAALAARHRAVRVRPQRRPGRLDTVSDGYTNGHYQQFGQMTGHITIGGDRITVDGRRSATAPGDRAAYPSAARSAAEGECSASCAKVRYCLLIALTVSAVMTTNQRKNSVAGSHQEKMPFQANGPVLK